MKLPFWNRKVHYWASIIIAIPSLVVICTGLLLQVKKQVPWVQPPERKGASEEPTLSLPQILAISRSVPEAGVRDWGDIQRIDARPSKGVVKVVPKSAWEIQIDAATGEVLQVAYRRSDLIESLHDGSWFHEWVKLGVFLPTGVTLLLLWLTGMYLFFLPFWTRWRKARRLTATASRRKDSATPGPNSPL
jgi:uncharacterized iron-regulated membrane protein